MNDDMIHVADLTHDAVVARYPELVANELAFEEEAVSIAKEAIEKAIADRGLAEGSPTAKRSLKSCVRLTARRIDEWLAEQSSTRRKSTVLNHLKGLEAQQLAYIVCRELLNTALLGDVGYTNACVKVGEAVRRTVEWALFEAANEGLAAELERQLNKTSSVKHRQGVFRAAMRAADFEGLKWDTEQKASIGIILVSAFCDATDLMEKVVTTNKKSQSSRLAPTATMSMLLSNADTFDAFLTPYHYPMVIPPKPWTDLDDGGYLNRQQHPLSMVKAKAKGHRAQLEQADLDDVIDSLNHIQSTPWRINLGVLEVMEKLHEEGDGSAKLASSAEPAVPEKPWGELSTEEWAEWKKDETNAATLKEWKAAARDAYHQRTRWASKRLVQQQQIKLAHRFAEEPAIYFPHTVDFRGRIYPAAGLGAVNPQGNDAGKGLLEFSRGKPLGPTGARWLAIHLANCFGVDKVSLDERELWTRMNAPMILTCAVEPLTDTRWMQADKPFQFLAACFEWLGYDLEGDDFVSHLPIAMDGSCSGLQHFAAMLRDQKTAEAVNVVQVGDRPSDVYGVVLKETYAQVENTALKARSGDPDFIAWEWMERMERNTVKQPVMTTPYGVTSRGVVGQIAANTKKAIGLGTMEPFSVTPYEAAIWLAPFVNEAIGTACSAAKAAMDWLTDCARITAKAGCPLRWETPVGFLAVQDYRKTNGRRVVVKWAGQTHNMTVQKTGSKLEARRQASGLAPNFVHSMDACHLMITVNNCAEYGIKDFAMVHDSFGCHACDTELHNQIIRECFIAMYSGDVLRDFYEGLRDQIPEEVFEKLSEPPEQGDLDLAAVRDSEFFFA